jgi:hypothetical protein
LRRKKYFDEDSSDASHLRHLRESLTLPGSPSGGPLVFHPSHESNLNPQGGDSKPSDADPPSWYERKGRKGKRKLDTDKINSKTVDGLLEFCDFLTDKGMATGKTMENWKGATRNVFLAVEGEGSISMNSSSASRPSPAASTSLRASALTAAGSALRLRHTSHS